MATNHKISLDITALRIPCINIHKIHKSLKPYAFQRQGIKPFQPDPNTPSQTVPKFKCLLLKDIIQTLDFPNKKLAEIISKYGCEMIDYSLYLQCDLLPKIKSYGIDCGTRYTTQNEKFLKGTPWVILKENETAASYGLYKYAKRNPWNIAYGKIIINPDNYPHAYYQWNIQLTKLYGSVFMGIIESKDVSELYYKNKVISFGLYASYDGYQRQRNRIYACGNDENTNMKYDNNDIITIIVQMSVHTIAFYRNGEFIGERNIGNVLKYRLVIQAISCKVSLMDFQFVRNVKDFAQSGTNIIREFVKAFYVDSEEKDYNDIMELISRYYSACPVISENNLSCNYKYKATNWSFSD